METESKIPKQDLLTKLLKMTSSSNDGEALTAIRKANDLMKSVGWDWDKLMAGKIKVAADPFANLQQPHNPGAGMAPPRAAKPAPRPTAPQPQPRPQPQPAPPRQPPPPPKPFEPFSHQTTNGQTNNFPGNCYCCGYSVSAKAGKLFTPSTFNAAAPSGKKVICDACDTNKHSFIDRRPAPQPKTQPFTGPAPRASDL